MALNIQSRRVKNSQNWAKIAEDYEKGMKIKDITAKYGISKAGVYKILARLAGKSSITA